MLILIRYSDQVIVFLYLIAPFGTSFGQVVEQIFRVLGRLVQIPMETPKFIGLCKNLKGTSIAIEKVRSLDLAVTVSAVIAQEYVFQESQVI